MIGPRSASAALFAVAIVTGTISDRATHAAPARIGDYVVLAADFHVHPSLPGEGALTPWDLVLEARRQGIDVFAITAHNEVFSAKIGRAFARLVGGPTVLVGQEITATRYHMIGVGLERTINWRQPAAGAIADVHAQGGAAIAAHPLRSFWDAYDDAALQTLDGSEVMHPVAYLHESLAAELIAFFRRANVTPIGSSDYHGLGELGVCRTYVFATANTERAVIEALRARRTVVFGVDGTAYGESALVAPLIERIGAPGAGVSDVSRAAGGTLAMLSRCSGLLALFIALVATRRHPAETSG